MSNRPIRRKVESIDPMFNIPDGVDELVHDEDASDNANYAEGSQEFAEGIIEEEIVILPVEESPQEEEDPTGKPPAPRVLGIIKQTLRTLKNGDERVDVVLEVEDIVGVDKYEFRVSKS